MLPHQFAATDPAASAQRKATRYQTMRLGHRLAQMRSRGAIAGPPAAWSSRLMHSSLYDPPVRRVLDDMHASADRNDPPLLEKARGKRGTERTSLLDDAFIPVSADAGRLLYVLARGAAPGTF